MSDCPNEDSTTTAGWVDSTLRNCVGAVDAGVSVNADDRPHGAGEIGVLKTSAVSGGAFKPRQNKAVVSAERNRVSQPVRGNSILMSRMNTPDLVGESCFVKEEWPQLYLPDRLWQLRNEHSERVYMRWLAYALQDKQSRRYIARHATGTSGSMKNLSKASLLAMPVSLPPLREQQQIAEILDTLDDQIRTTEQIIAKIETVRLGLARDLLRVGSEGDWDPDDWEIRSLGDVIGGIDAGKSPDCPNRPATAGRWGVLKVSAVGAHGFVEEENKEIPASTAVDRRSEVHPGDVLMTRANTPDLVGMACIVRQQPVARLALSDKTWRIRPGEMINPEFLAEALRSVPVRRFVQAQATGTSGSMKNIPKSAACKIRLPVPFLNEQRRIATILSAERKREDVERRKVAGLQALKQGLMADLLNGRVRVPVETAS